VRDFRGLDVWRKAHALMLNVRRATHDFHRKRSGPLQTQITRSSEGISNSIVEGCFAATQKEFARYLDISIKSSGETENQLQQARDRGLLGAREWRSLSAQTIEVRKMLIGLRKKILRDLLDEEGEADE
jgi:four helix bundle protein